MPSNADALDNNSNLKDAEDTIWYGSETDKVSMLPASSVAMSASSDNPGTDILDLPETPHLLVIFCSRSLHSPTLSGGLWLDSHWTPLWKTPIFSAENWWNFQWLSNDKSGDCPAGQPVQWNFQWTITENSHGSPMDCHQTAPDMLGDAPRPPMFPLIFLRHLCIFLLIVASPRRSALAAPIPESDDHVT